MKLRIVAGNRYQVDGYARTDLQLHRDEYLRVDGHRLDNIGPDATIILGPDYHREMGMRGMELLNLYAQARDWKLLHWRDDAAAITEAIAAMRASFGE